MPELVELSQPHRLNFGTPERCPGTVKVNPAHVASISVGKFSGEEYTSVRLAGGDLYLVPFRARSFSGVVHDLRT